MQLKTKNLKKIYGKQPDQVIALKDLDLEIKKGEKLAVVGKSGSGKSTLLHILAGLDSPTSGQIWLNDVEFSKFKQDKLANIRNKNFGFVFQQFFLMPKLSVLENVVLPLKIAGYSIKTRRERAKKALEEVGLGDRLNSKANDLSGGQKQRVAIARAIVTEPAIVFADEPTGNLDSENGKKVMDILLKLNKEKGITLVLVTHDMDLANLCDKIIILKDGEIQKN